MPQATNLVVKNGASTPVDKTFTLLAPSAGYGGMAEWALKEGSTVNAFPRFTALVRPTKGSRPGQHLQTKFRMPSSYTDAVSGAAMVTSVAEFHATVIMPDSFPESARDDFVAFSTNLFRTTLLQAMIRDGLPAT